MKAYSKINSVFAGKDTKENPPALLERLLSKRGIQTADDITFFLSPDYEKHTHDPYLLPDMEKAVDRVLKSVSEGEKIIVYADYDADGIPGAVVLSDFFKKINFENFEVYIPHRHEEGFGLNDDAVEKFSSENAGLIVTVDCGSSGNGPIDLANRLGMDVIITDHHIPSDPEPSAFALVNPKRAGSKYPFKELSGAAVAFKLVQALLLKLRSTNYDLSSVPVGWEKWLLDMVGIATLSDMVPLVGENRVFAKYGLKVLQKSRRPGIKALCRKLRLNQSEIGEDDIGFTITPRINAASRMDEPMDAFRLLSAESLDEGQKFADHLDHINNERKGHVAAMVKEAKKRLDKIHSLSEVVVIGDPRWRTGLVGLAAQRIAEDYGKPAFVWGREGGEVIRGSARSPGQTSVMELMSNCSEVFIEYGGHDFSGGFSISQENIHSLETALIASFRKSPNKVEGDKARLSYDEELSLIDVNWEVWDVIDKLSPFGEANPKPVFLFRNASVKDVKTFGKESNHLKLELEKPSGAVVEALSFFSTEADFEVGVRKGKSINLLATLERSVFRGRPELRLRIVDIVDNI